MGKRNLILALMGIAGTAGSVAFLQAPYYIIFIVIYIAIIILVIKFAESTKNLTAEKYIQNQNKKMRTILQNIHNIILETSPMINSVIIEPKVFPQYYYYNAFLTAVQKNIGGKSIRFYLRGETLQPLLNHLGSRSSSLQYTNRNEFLIAAAEPMDYELIKDIIEFLVKKFENDGTEQPQ